MYVYVPAASPDCNPVPEYGGVPPFADTEADPSDPPKQVTSLTSEHVA